MKARISVAPYSLKSKSILGRSSSPERSGALIKLESDQVSGYADLHPWPELGDPTLEQQLSDLKRSKFSSQLLRSLEFAKRDREARLESRSLFSDIGMPQSHFLIGDLNYIDLKVANDFGFKTLKIKVGRNLKMEAEILNANALEFSRFQLRIDFNAQTTTEQASSWVAGLDSNLRIDFVEDPSKNSGEWGKIREKIAVASDFVIGDADVRVVKPAIEDGSYKTASKRHCFTTYLDHPVGALHASVEAMKFGDPRETHGLCSHLSYTMNEYSDQLAIQDARLVVDRDQSGIGFTALLEKEKWSLVFDGEIA